MLFKTWSKRNQEMVFILYLFDWHLSAVKSCNNLVAIQTFFREDGGIFLAYFLCKMRAETRAQCPPPHPHLDPALSSPLRHLHKVFCFLRTQQSVCDGFHSTETVDKFFNRIESERNTPYSITRRGRLGENVLPWLIKAIHVTFISAAILKHQIWTGLRRKAGSDYKHVCSRGNLLYLCSQQQQQKNWCLFCNYFCLESRLCITEITFRKLKGRNRIKMEVLFLLLFKFNQN